jgi:predicted TIM-barrel fold metal-dependent hydrolase
VKLHPWVQGFSLSVHPALEELCEVAGAHNAAMIFHDGTPPYCYPSQIASLARRHRGTKFLLGHAGLLHLWRDAIAAAQACDNLWMCLCGPHQAGMREIVRHMDSTRIVWGSDFGFGTADSVGYRLGVLDALGLSPSARCAMLEDNPVRLIGQ